MMIAKRVARGTVRAAREAWNAVASGGIVLDGGQVTKQQIADVRGRGSPA
jgi:predicted sugar kinase